ncbi:MAG TPA: hypothetical protein VJM08_13355 [Anaerolineales bacterium]|nr:hypothetical protein [Anaerolineales bacterium]
MPDTFIIVIGFSNPLHKAQFPYIAEVHPPMHSPYLKLEAASGVAVNAVSVGEAVVGTINVDVGKLNIISVG